MKLSEAPTKIIGVALGEASINLIRPGELPFKARFAILTDSGTAGYVDIGEWTPEAAKALETFIAVLETEALNHLFKVPTAQAAETPQGDAANEPPQF